MSREELASLESKLEIAARDIENSRSRRASRGAQRPRDDDDDDDGDDEEDDDDDMAQRLRRRSNEDL